LFVKDDNKNATACPFLDAVKECDATAVSSEFESLVQKNKTNGQVMSYTLVAENEADLKLGKISVSSPIGKGLLGKKVGDTAEISVPSGKLMFEIMEISR